VLNCSDRTYLSVQLDVALWEQDWRWHCERSFMLTLGNGVADLFFIDTNPAISDYQTAVFANNTGEQPDAATMFLSSSQYRNTSPMTPWYSQPDECQNPVMSSELLIDVLSVVRYRPGSCAL